MATSMHPDSSDQTLCRMPQTQVQGPPYFIIVACSRHR